MLHPSEGVAEGTEEGPALVLGHAEIRLVTVPVRLDPIPRLRQSARTTTRSTRNFPQHIVPSSAPVQTRSGVTSKPLWFGNGVPCLATCSPLVTSIAVIEPIVELNIGFSIVARAVFDGVEHAVLTMLQELEAARG